MLWGARVAYNRKLRHPPASMPFSVMELHDPPAPDVSRPPCLDACRSLHPHLLGSTNPLSLGGTMATPAPGAFLGLALSSCSSGALCNSLEEPTLTENNSLKVTVHLKKYGSWSPISKLGLGHTGCSVGSLSRLTSYFSR